MTHTKGPWKVEHDGPSRPIIITGESMLSISRYEDGKWVSYGEQEEADAIMMAAAPELLEAMRHIESSTTRNGEVPQMHRHVNNLAREAIAKAEGR